MGMVAPERRIASAFVVFCGAHGSVTRYANDRGVCRQWIYREAAWLRERLADQQKIERLQQELEDTKARVAEKDAAALRTVEIDEEKQSEFACVGQALGVSLSVLGKLLGVLIPGQQQSVATLGRQTQAMGKRAGELLAVLDEAARPLARELLADEIHVKRPVFMAVEAESLCWLTGRQTETVSGEAWAEELARYPNLEQVTRDGGKGLATAVAMENAARQTRGHAPLVDQGDHFHALRDGGTGLRWLQIRAGQTLAKAEKAQRAVKECERRGQHRGRAAARARGVWQMAERAMNYWSKIERLWQQTKEALPLFTAEGELNTRQRAEAVLAEILPQLPDQGFAKSKRALRQPEMLRYLDRLHEQLQALPFSPEVKQAALRQEGLRRRPELLQGESQQAAARRGIWLMCMVVLSLAGAVGEQAVAAVREICRRACRASSLVECVNSVLRMQQARHRRMSQGLLDLKRLYWNSHPFRTGRRRNTTPYQRLGIHWPPGLNWWAVLKLTPEQLREKLSTAKDAP